MAIVPLEERYLLDIADIFLEQEGTTIERRRDRTAAYLRSLYLDAPYVDPELPSLVSLAADGTVDGFLGVMPGSLRFRGQLVRYAASGPLLTRVASRSRTPGAFLIRAFLDGAQDLALTDGCNERAWRVFSALGAEVVGLPSIRWFRPLRPLRTAGWFAAERLNRGRTLASIGGALDRAAARRLVPKPVATRGRQLSPAELIAVAGSLCGDFDVVPEYTEEVLGWKIRDMRETTAKGQLRCLLVTTSSGRELGWLVYHLQPGGICRLVQLGATTKTAPQMVAHLMADAYSLGGGVVYGRIESHCRAALHDEPVVLRPSSPLMVIHSTNDELRATIHGGRAFLTRLEGENWAGLLHQPLP
jgi:hypothetical protein